MNKEWKCIEDRSEKKLSCWKGKLMSYGGRLVLVNLVLTSLSMFLLSFFEVPVGVRKRLDFYRSRFFWQSDETKKKYRLARWDINCRRKDHGGLGNENLEVKYTCLLSKWLFKLLSVDMYDISWCRTNTYSAKYCLSFSSDDTGHIHFWKGLGRVQYDFFTWGSFWRKYTLEAIIKLLFYISLFMIKVYYLC